MISSNHALRAAGRRRCVLSGIARTLGDHEDRIVGCRRTLCPVRQAASSSRRSMPRCAVGKRIPTARASNEERPERVLTRSMSGSPVAAYRAPPKWPDFPVGATRPYGSEACDGFATTRHCRRSTAATERSRRISSHLCCADQRCSLAIRARPSVTRHAPDVVARAKRGAARDEPRLSCPAQPGRSVSRGFRSFLRGSSFRCRTGGQCVSLDERVPEGAFAPLYLRIDGEGVASDQYPSSDFTRQGMLVCGRYLLQLLGRGLHEREESPRLARPRRRLSAQAVARTLRCRPRGQYRSRSRSKHPVHPPTARRNGRSAGRACGSWSHRRLVDSRESRQTTLEAATSWGVGSCRAFAAGRHVPRP